MDKKPTREFVEKLTDPELKQIIIDYCEFEKQGWIGDCLLRSTAKTFLKSIGDYDTRVVFWMEHIVFEVYRIFAERYLKNCTID